MAEETHREKAHTAGTLTMTIIKVFFSASRKVSSRNSREKLVKPMKLPNMSGSCILVSVRLVMMQMIMGMTTKPRKKIRLGSRNR